MASGRNVIFMSQKGAQPELAKTVKHEKNSELGLPTRCFFFLLILLINSGTKLTKKAIKKPIFRTLWRVEKYRLCNLLTKINIGIEYHVLDFET